MDQKLEISQIIDSGFEVMLSSVAADGFDKSWLGRSITKKDVEKLEVLHNKYGINIAGEGGEFESVVINGPFFKKKIVIKQSKIVEENEHTATFIIEKASLAEK